MFSTLRTATLALATIASLGLATLVTSTTSADARGGGFSGGSHGGMSHSASRSFGGQRHFGSPRLIGGDRISRTPRHIGRDRISRHPHFAHRRHHNWCHLTRRCGIHVRFHRPWIYGTSVVAASGYSIAPTYAAPRCTCLTKEYTQDGQVVFQDVCTKEVASAPIGNTQAQLPLPQQQAPVQQ
jgi:hypothetical protein